jgi:hypothetical protein
MKSAIYVVEHKKSVSYQKSAQNDCKSSLKSSIDFQ